jgi:hypothetical protein
MYRAFYLFSEKSFILPLTILTPILKKSNTYFYRKAIGGDCLYVILSNTWYYFKAFYYDHIKKGNNSAFGFLLQASSHAKTASRLA